MPEITDVFKALSDRTRLRLLKLLTTGEEYCVCELVDALQVRQCTVSRHLSILRGLGLVQVRREGNLACYRLVRPQAEPVETVLACLANRLDGEEFQADRRRLEERCRLRVGGKCVKVVGYE